jgi:hypothetical protein
VQDLQTTDVNVPEHSLQLLDKSVHFLQLDFSESSEGK